VVLSRPVAGLTLMIAACVVEVPAPVEPTPAAPTEAAAPAAEEAVEEPAAEEAAEEPAAAPTEKWRLGAIEKTLINEHWQFMKEGYEFAARRYDVEVEVGSVPTEADTAAQLALLESWLTKDFNALAVSPISPNNLNPALAKASEMGIPIINVDELIPPEVAGEAGIEIETRIASNNYFAGVLAGRYMLEHLQPGDKVAVIEGIAGNASGTARRDGFVDTATAGGLDLVSSQPADWDRAKANAVTTNILQANPDLRGIYYANDTMALGGTEAVQAAGREGEIILIGTDAIPEALQAVGEGRLTGTIAQFPYEMGFLAVESAIKILEGRPVAEQIDAPIKLLLAADVTQ
jgi:D-allose transport system substrate-binding protein